MAVFLLRSPPAKVVQATEASYPSSYTPDNKDLGGFKSADEYEKLKLSELFS